MSDIWDKNFKEIESMDLTFDEILEDIKEDLIKDVKQIPLSPIDKTLKSMPCNECNLKDICKYAFDIEGVLKYNMNIFDIKVECKIRKEKGK